MGIQEQINLLIYEQQSSKILKSLKLFLHNIQQNKAFVDSILYRF